MRSPAVFAAAFALIAAFACPALAQQIAMGGVKSDPSAPVEVTSDSLSVNQQTGIATFTGNVLVVQGGMRLKATSVTVTYDAQDRSKIETMQASGGVTMVSPTEAAQGSAAVYDVARGNVVMTGDVILTQGPNVMSGSRLSVDLRSGTGQMDGRVRTILQPNQQSTGAKP